MSSIRCSTGQISKYTDTNHHTAGADLSELQHLTTAEAHRSHYLQDLCTAISSLRIPIIACVAGFALGGGFELAMMCDIIYSSDDAKFGLPELSIGTFPGMGGTQRLTRALGKSKAMDMILTSSTVSGKELRRLGLVAQTWPEEELLMKTMAAAHKIAALSTPIVEMAKAAILTGLFFVLGCNGVRVADIVCTAEQTDLDAGLKYERALYYSSLSLEDRSEGMAAFNEKRTPAFKNK